MVKSKSFKSLRALYDLKIKALHNSRSIINENKMRPELVEALDIMEHMFSMYDEEKTCKTYHKDSFYNLPRIAHQIMNPVEIQFTLKKINGWIESGFEEAKRQLVDLALIDLISTNSSSRKLGLDDKILVSIIVKHGPGYIERLGRYLYIDAVRELFLQKYKEQCHNDKCAFYLGKYYYEQKEYTASFNFLKNIGGETFYKERCSYLGLIYYYGNGVGKDWTKAKYLLEEVIKESDYYKDEIVCALGEIYEQKVSIKKALELYEKVLKNAGYKEKPHFPNLIRKYMDLKETTTLSDRIILTVEISTKNLKCEFSVELPPHSHALVNWGERENKLTGAPSNNERKIIKFRHKYHKPGIYRINIETICGRTLEGIEFSRYKNQLKSIKFERTLGIRKISIIGQQLKNLKLPKSKFLNGVICRRNRIEILDLSPHPQLTHIDCSYNPLIELRHASVIVPIHICLRGTSVSRNDLVEPLKLNGGSFVNHICYYDLEDTDMTLEFYFRLTNWRKVKDYLKKEQSFDYNRDEFNCKELESVFNCLKQMSNNRNQTPYKKGYLEVYDSFVCDNTIIGAEEFFITEKEWTICLATKVRNCKLCEPWLGIDPPPPEYFVANCLLNMINNKSEREKYLFGDN